MAIGFGVKVEAYNIIYDTIKLMLSKKKLRPEPNRAHDESTSTNNQPLEIGQTPAPNVNSK